MKKRAFVGLLLTCLLATFAIYGVFAQSEPLLGVKEGDNFTYMFLVNWNSADANVVVPQEFSDMNKTLSINFNVTGAGGYMASLNITTKLRDGTVNSEMGYAEILRGGSVGAPLFLIGANLTSGDHVYPQSEPAAVVAGQAAAPFTINDTLTKTYLGTSRTVNHYGSTEANASSGDSVSRNCYYDQATGLLMEMTIEHYWASLGETDSEHWRITQFNSAVAPPNENNNDGNGSGTNTLPSWLIPAVVVAVVVVVVAVIAVLMMKRKRKSSVQPEMPQQTQAQTPV